MIDFNYLVFFIQETYVTYEIRTAQFTFTSCVLFLNMSYDFYERLTTEEEHLNSSLWVGSGQLSPLFFHIEE